MLLLLIGKYKNIYEGNLDVSDQDVVDEATLRKYGENYFKTTLCDVIEESIEIDVVGAPDEPVGIFDTVTIFHEKFNLDVKKKITKYTYSPMGRKLKTIGFGKIQSNLGTTLASMVDNAIEEKAETMLDAFKIQKNLAQLLKLDRKGIEDKLVELEEKSKGALEVKKALFEADGTIPDVVKTKILDAVEGDIGRLKTIITEAELIKAIQAKLNFAEIKNALIDKAFINQIISDEKFTQQFEDGEVTTQNIFTKLKDSIKSNISKEFVTKDGVRKLVNDLTIDADGIRQITQQESQKVFNTSITGKVQEIVGEVKKNLPTKEELKGKSSYLHKKYSDFEDGRNMSDNSTLKYIGIYTGDKQQAPTNASEYSWTKIRGEDGARGRDGERGRDGNVELNLLNGTKEFITSYFAPPYSWQQAYIWVDETERYEDFAVKSTIYQFNGLWQNVKVEKGKTYEFGFYAKGSRDTNKIMFSPGWESDNAKRPLAEYSIRDTEFTLTTNWKFHSFRFTVTSSGWSQCRVEKNEDNNGIKFSLCGLYLKELKNNQSAPLGWSPSIEDLQGHSLTANLRIEGRYVNSITTNVKPYLDVYYDGQKITSGFNAQVKYKGGNSYDWSGFWTADVGADGGITNIDWGNREQNGTPLEVIVLVTYKGLNTVANARMENIPDVVEIKEITKKYKTFESTIDQFNSTIGEVKQQVLANEEKRNLIIGSRLLNDSDYKVFGKVWEGFSKQGIYTQIRQSSEGGVSLYNGNSYLYVVAQNNTQNVWQGVGFKLSKNFLDYRVKYSLRIPFLILNDFTLDKGIYMEIKNHNTGEIIWNQRLDKQTIDGREQDIYKGIWIERTATFRNWNSAVLSDYSFWIYAVQNGGFCISTPYMCEGDTLPNTYSPAPEDVHLQNSRIESSIKQTKDEIDLKVSKDNVIASINASVETTGNGNQGVVKINADKVDISGVLSAYSGKIGAFSIGKNTHSGYGQWITGVNHFNIGMSDGTNGDEGAALWVNWGYQWGEIGDNAWYVLNNGKMFCRNYAYFAKQISAPSGMDVNQGNVWGYATTGRAGKTYTIWWSEIDKVKSQVSDKRLKTNIKPTKVNAVDMLNNIEMVEFNWKKDGKFEKIGAIAQQVQSIDKDLVVKDAIDKDTPSDYLRINYYDTIPYLIKAVQELSEENDSLKSQLQLMNERLTKLEEQLNGKL